MNKKAFLTLFLIFLMLFATSTFLEHGRNFAGKSYFESEHYGLTMLDEFYRGLSKYVLSDFNKEEALSEITVTEQEINNYRTYYGSLEEQKEDIRIQYEDEINLAEGEETRSKLISERDAKIKEIERNFQDEDAVEAKIMEIKTKAVEEYAKQIEAGKKEFERNYSFIGYNLENTYTGKRYVKYKDEDLVFTETFNERKPLVLDNNVHYIEYSEPGVQFSLSQSSVHDETHSEYESYEYAEFKGSIYIPYVYFNKTEYAEQAKEFNITKVILYIIWASGLIALVAFIKFKLFRLLKDTLPGERKFNKLPFDLRLISWLIILYFVFVSLSEIKFEIPYWFVMNDYDYFIMLFKVAFNVVIILGGILITVYMLKSFIQKDQVVEEFQTSILYKIWCSVTDAFLNKSLGLQYTWMLLVMFLSGVGIVGVFFAPFLLLIYFPLFVVVTIPSLLLFYRYLGSMNRIMEYTKRNANGEIVKPLNIKGTSIVANHARHIQNLQDGIRQSMEEQAKSERLKTELITNVSHDLRTPLTSIITYTDLLKNPELTVEERDKYVKIVDQKAARLKTLIEDLFEVSKMASGNIEIQKAKVDLSVMLQQIAAEHEEDYKKQQLDLRVIIEDQPIFAYVDGQKWWRVYDNLLVNARKYSMPSTRVYSNLRIVGNKAVFTIKNIANYELNDTAEELVERFKRADESRHTEGSGLGLAIAQSIVDLHEGHLKIEVDGDLFKVTVELSL